MMPTINMHETTTYFSIDLIFGVWYAIYKGTKTWNKIYKIYIQGVSLNIAVGGRLYIKWKPSRF